VPSRDPWQPLTEASYLTSEAEGCRLLARAFYDLYQRSQYYAGLPDLLPEVRRIDPTYTEEACHRHLDLLEAWGAIRLVPDQSRPKDLQELRTKPRIYQAERILIWLEELRQRLEQDEGAAALNETALDSLLEMVEGFVAWVEGGALHDRAAQDEVYRRWDDLHRTFTAFATSVQEYLSDLPRHRPKELLDYTGFLDYRDVLTQYLSTYAKRLSERRDQFRHLLHRLAPHAELLAGVLATKELEIVRANAQRADWAAQLARYRQEIEAIATYFAPGGPVDVNLELAAEWVREILRHAIRLTERHRGGTLMEETLKNLGRRFAAMELDAPEEGLRRAQALAQVAFALQGPLHWRGIAPLAEDRPAWTVEPMAIQLQVVKRGRRERGPADRTPDRTDAQLQRMIEAHQARAEQAERLAALFGPTGELDLGALQVAGPEERQLLLHLLYRALSGSGSAGVGFRNWRVTAHVSNDAAVGTLAGPDGTLRLPHVTLRLERDARGAQQGSAASEEVAP
jgi:uncharacterized protein (TIGR02677 family)